MKSLLATRVSDGWVVTLRHVMHVPSKDTVFNFIDTHNLEKNDLVSTNDVIYAEDNQE